MTPTRTWLALGALLVAIVGGTVWAAEQEKKAPKACCADKCCATEKACCETKVCVEEKAKSCCADGKCCGCCAKTQAATVPATVNVMIAPPLPGFCPAPTPMDAPACVAPVAPAPVYALPPPAPEPVQWAPVAQYAPAARYFPPVTPPPPAPQAACAPGFAGLWQVCVVEDHGKPCLQMSPGCAADLAATCESLVLKTGGHSLKLAVAGKQVQVTGQRLKVTADSVSCGEAHGDLMLHGSVKLKYDTDGHKAEITADHVVVGVSDGRIEVMGAGRQAVRQAVPAVTCPACEEVFDFWTGFFH